MNTIKIDLITVKDKYDINRIDEYPIPREFIFNNFIIEMSNGTEKHSWEVKRIEEDGIIFRPLKSNNSSNFIKMFFTKEYSKEYGMVINEKDEICHGQLAIPFDEIDENDDFYDRAFNNQLYYDGAVQFGSLIMISMSYIMHEGIKRYRQYKKSGGHKYKYSREYRVSTEKNKIYLFDDIINYVSDNYIPSAGHHEIQCPCWEVRGHYRHYKSGKVVFIPSYKKGKQRETVKPKEKEYYA